MKWELYAVIGLTMLCVGLVMFSAWLASCCLRAIFG